MVGALLTQNTSWKNVELALTRLKAHGPLTPETLGRMSDDALADCVRPAGYFRQKTKRLRNLLRFLAEHHNNELDSLLQQDTESLREQLLQINGIGPETADSIVLYAAHRARFVIDAYTARVFKRHGWIEYEADYHAMQDYAESSLARDVALFNEFHALLVRVGKDHCRTKPICEGCPLQSLLPEGGMCEPMF
jgi:endonuclease-3 related protein